MPRSRTYIAGAVLLGALSPLVYLYVYQPWADERAFAKARLADTAAAYRGYLALHGAGAHADEARQLMTAATFEKAIGDGDTGALVFLTKAFGDHPSAQAARDRLAALSWAEAQKADDELGYGRFARDFAESPEALLARRRASELAKARAAGKAGARYHEDVEPILQRSCLGCHGEGGIAPFTLTTYADAVSHAAAIAIETAARRMPPWHADNSGTCHTWQSARWLDDDELGTIQAWVLGGTPEGDPAKAPTRVVPDDRLARITKTIDIGGTYAPSASLTDDYRCFPIDLGTQSDKYLVGYQVHPGEKRVVHHVILFAIEKESEDMKASVLDASEPGLGYTCFGEPGVDARFIAGWTPGSPAIAYPEGTGVKVWGGRRLILQVHYTLENGSLPDRTTIDLELADQVAKPAYIDKISAEVYLPPKKKIVTTQSWLANKVFPISEHGGTLYAVYPHMHLLGVRQHLELERAGVSSCLVDVPEWDFHWQQFYMYEEPVRLEPNDRIRITCDYDTTNEDQTVTWGEGSRDEMCLAYMYVTQ